MEDDNSNTIWMILRLTGRLDHHDLDEVSHEDAKAYAASHSDVRYEWWTEKTGPGTSRVAWRLTKESAS